MYNMKLKAFIALLVIITNVVASTGAYAQDVPRTLTLPSPPTLVLGEKDVGSAISPLKKGQLAPFTGILLSPKAAAVVIANVDAINEQLKIELNRVRAEEKARFEFELAETRSKLEADSSILTAQLDERNKRIIILNDIVDEHEKNRSNTPLWVGLGVGGGVLVGIGLTVLTVSVVK